LWPRVVGSPQPGVGSAHGKEKILQCRRRQKNVRCFKTWAADRYVRAFCQRRTKQRANDRRGRHLDGNPDGDA